MIAMTKYIDKK